MGGGVGGEVAGAIQGTATCVGKRGGLQAGLVATPSDFLTPKAAASSSYSLFSRVPEGVGHAPCAVAPPPEGVSDTELAQPLQVDTAFLCHSHAPRVWTLHSAPVPLTIQPRKPITAPLRTDHASLCPDSAPLLRQGHTPLLWPRLL